MINYVIPQATQTHVAREGCNARGEGGKRRGLGPRNDVLTTCKAVTPRGDQRIIAAFFPL